MLVSSQTRQMLLITSAAYLVRPVRRAFIKAFVSGAVHSGGQCRGCECKLIQYSYNLTVNYSVKCKVLGKGTVLNCLLGLD